jgi:hypothetical protein
VATDSGDWVTLQSGPRPGPPATVVMIPGPAAMAGAPGATTPASAAGTTATAASHVRPASDLPDQPASL